MAMGYGEQMDRTEVEDPILNFVIQLQTRKTNSSTEQEQITSKWIQMNRDSSTGCVRQIRIRTNISGISSFAIWNHRGKYSSRWTQARMSGQGCRGSGTRRSLRILINWQELLCFITFCCLYTILLENGKSFLSLYGFVNGISYMNSANQVTKLCRCRLGMGQISQLRFPISLYLCQKQFLVQFMNYNEFLIYRIKILNVLL